MGGREANALREWSTAPETGSRFIVMFWIVCVLSELRALRLRLPLERSAARERVLMVVSISRRVCVYSNGHYFETDATSGAVNRSRGGCDGHLHSSDGLGALKYHHIETHTTSGAVDRSRHVIDRSFCNPVRVRLTRG